MAVCHSSFFSLRLTPFCLVDAAADVLVVLSDSVAAMRVMRIMMIVMLMCVCVMIPSRNGHDDPGF